MKVTVGSTAYTKLRSLSFAPDADVTGNTLPINELTVDIITSDAFGQRPDVILEDDLGNLWASFKAESVARIDSSTVRIKAKSKLASLGSWDRDAVMCSDTPLTDILDEFLGVSGYTLDASLQNATVSGYMPAQTGRVRLQWVLLSVGAFLRQVFAGKPEILPIPAPGGTALSVPVEDTYYKPETVIPETGVVAKMWATAYVYRRFDDWTADKTVTVGDVSYIVLERRFWLGASGFPLTEQNRVAAGVMTLTPDNVVDVLKALYPYYFGKRRIVADVINNAAYRPGDAVSQPVSETERKTGVIRSEDFSFGLQAKSRMEILEFWADSNVHTGQSLTLTHSFAGDSDVPAAVLDTEYFTVPANMVLAWDNPFQYDTVAVYRPQMPTQLAAVYESAVSVTVDYDCAVYRGSSALLIRSLSSFKGLKVQTSASFAYKKNIVLQLDGTATAYSDVVSLQFPTADSSSARWFPADFVSAYEQQTGTIVPLQFLDLVLREGPVNTVFSGVGRIKIPLSGGGTCDWVAIEEVNNV